MPSWIEIAKTDDDKKLLWLFGANADIGKSIVAPPGYAAGADRDAARVRFRRCSQDPAFLADVKKAHMDFDHAPGERLQQIVDRYDSSCRWSLRDRARTIYRSTGSK